MAALTADVSAAASARAWPARIRFAAIGLNHGHINGQTEAVLRGGGELVSVFAKEPDLRRRLREAVSAGEGRAE